MRGAGNATPVGWARRTGAFEGLRSSALPPLDDAPVEPLVTRREAWMPRRRACTERRSRHVGPDSAPPRRRRRGGARRSSSPRPSDDGWDRRDPLPRPGHRPGRAPTRDRRSRAPAAVHPPTGSLPGPRRPPPRSRGRAAEGRTPEGAATSGSASISPVRRSAVPGHGRGASARMRRPHARRGWRSTPVRWRGSVRVGARKDAACPTFGCAWAWRQWVADRPGRRNGS